MGKNRRRSSSSSQHNHRRHHHHSSGVVLDRHRRRSHSQYSASSSHIRPYLGSSSSSLSSSSSSVSLSSHLGDLSDEAHNDNYGRRDDVSGMNANRHRSSRRSCSRSRSRSPSSSHSYSRDRHHRQHRRHNHRTDYSNRHVHSYSRSYSRDRHYRQHRRHNHRDGRSVSSSNHNDYSNKRHVSKAARKEYFSSKYSDLPLEFWDRSEECQAAKSEHMDRIDSISGSSREVVILSTTLYSHDIVLEENMFPYDCPTGILHYTLWAKEDMSHDEINYFICAWLDRNMPQVRRWQYDDNLGERSILLFHVHVFIETIPFTFTPREGLEYCPPHMKQNTNNSNNNNNNNNDSSDNDQRPHRQEEGKEVDDADEQEEQIHDNQQQQQQQQQRSRSTINVGGLQEN